MISQRYNKISETSKFSDISEIYSSDNSASKDEIGLETSEYSDKSVSAEFSINTELSSSFDRISFDKRFYNVIFKNIQS